MKKQLKVVLKPRVVSRYFVGIWKKNPVSDDTTITTSGMICTRTGG